MYTKLIIFFENYMRSTTFIWAAIIFVVLGLGAWYYTSSQTSSSMTPENSAAGTVLEGSRQNVDAADNPFPAPSGASPSSASGQAGINGSANQGNMGQPDSASTGSGQAGVVQQPGADGAEGSIIGNNLALGLDSNATLGKYLIAYNGMTLYTYSKDTTEASTCYDKCAQNWPPYLVGAEDNVNNVKLGVNGKVGSTLRTDGGIQVTYNGHPLYFYVKDAESGDTTGQNVGSVWFVVKP